jgi:hypothetical protein
MDYDIHSFCYFQDVIIIIIKPENPLLPWLFPDFVYELKTIVYYFFFQYFQIIYFKIQHDVIVFIQVDFAAGQFLEKGFSIQRQASFEPNVINPKIGSKLQLQDVFIKLTRPGNLFYDNN